jgi:hypothetical protein
MDFQHLIQVEIFFRLIKNIKKICFLIGSYVSAYKNHRRRLQDEKANPKSVITEYKNFVQNGGFGPAFGNVDHQTYEEKV